VDPFPDTHIIAYFAPDTITYEEPTIPPFLNKEPPTELSTLYIYCVHHHNNPVSPPYHLTHLRSILHTLHISYAQVQPDAPTPPHSPVKQNLELPHISPTTKLP
jgi:hypothetical protein